MREFLKNLIKAKEERAAQLRELIKNSTDVNECRSLGKTLEAVLAEIADTKELLEQLDDPADPAEPARGQLNVLATMQTRTATEPAAENDPRATMEYRTAFMNYVQTGARSEHLQLERRDDQTELSDLGVLIPTTIVKEIIKGAEKIYGRIYAKVKKTNLKGGVKYPTGSFSATFHRITENGAPSARQNGNTARGYIEFGYKIGEIRLAQTLLMSIMQVEVFEKELAKVMLDAYVEAMEKEIFFGNPTDNEMCGILNNSSDGIQRITALTGHVIEISPSEMLDWKTWQKKLFAAIPLSMRGAKPEFAMSATTYESNLMTLEDSNGRPVARDVYNPVTGDDTATFKGKEVQFVEDDIFAGYDDTDAGEYFGIYWVPDKAYAINSNLEFAVRRYFDEEKNQYVDKGIVINDGKILDPEYIFLLKKVADDE